MQGACEVRGLAGKGPPHVSTGLGTMLLGVSGSCEDREVTSLPEELPREPDSEKETWGSGDTGKERVKKRPSWFSRATYSQRCPLGTSHRLGAGPWISRPGPQAHAGVLGWGCGLGNPSTSPASALIQGDLV